MYFSHSTAKSLASIVFWSLGCKCQVYLANKIHFKPDVLPANLGVHKVGLSEDSASITAMISLEGELVQLAGKGVAVDEQVEVWLGRLASQMQVTLQVRNTSVSDKKTIIFSSFNVQARFLWPA